MDSGTNAKTTGAATKRAVKDLMFIVANGDEWRSLAQIMGSLPPATSDCFRVEMQVRFLLTVDS